MVYGQNLTIPDSYENVIRELNSQYVAFLCINGFIHKPVSGIKHFG
jgi:hypothetical protein